MIGLYIQRGKRGAAERKKERKKKKTKKKFLTPIKYIHLSSAVFMLYLYIYLRDGWPSADVYKTCRRGCIDTRETKEEKNIYFSCNTGKKIKIQKEKTMSH